MYVCDYVRMGACVFICMALECFCFCLNVHDYVSLYTIWLP